MTVNEKLKKPYIGLAVCIVLMFLWLFIVVLLTGERDFDEFTATDDAIFTGFFILEGITAVMMFADLAYICYLEKKYGLNKLPPMAPADKRKHIQGLCLFLASVFAGAGFYFAGVFSICETSRAYAPALTVALVTVCVVPFVFLAVNIILSKCYVKKFSSKPVGELQNYFLTHRESAETTSREKLARLKALKRFSDAYAALLGVFGALTAFIAGIMEIEELVLIFPTLSFFLFLTSFSQIRFAPSKRFYLEDSSYVRAEEYPCLFSVIQKAAGALKREGEIKLSLIPGCNAGIARVGNVYSVQLGVVLLSIMTSEELYAILLHEFSHITPEAIDAEKLRSYNVWLCEGGTPRIFRRTTRKFYAYFDVLYVFEFILYSYSTSVIIEAAADRAMGELADSKTAASALLKLKYYELYSLECETKDFISPYISEEPPTERIKEDIMSFCDAVKLRSGDWNKLANVEILARTATHPTTRMRLEALKVDEYGIISIETDGESPYISECRCATSFVEKLISDDLIKTYEQIRKEYYLSPKETVDTWEANNMPINPSEYGEIYRALVSLGRVSDGEALCDRAIAELSPQEANFAKYIKGVYLLRRYDSSGVSLIYEALENDGNYLEEGLDIIGRFFCITGRQAELDEYRRKAVELAQKARDDIKRKSAKSK